MTCPISPIVQYCAIGHLSLSRTVKNADSNFLCYRRFACFIAFTHNVIYVKVSLWFAPMALYAVKTSRSNTYGDMSESMFQSLKHPEVGIPADKVENSCDALISFFWNNRVYVFNPVEENISEGGRFQPPRRWLNRTTVSTALRGLVVDVSGSSELKEETEESVDDDDEESEKPLGRRAEMWLQSMEDRKAAEAVAAAEAEALKKSSRKGKGKAKAEPIEVVDSSAARPTDGKQVNLAEYAEVLDAMSEPLPMKLFYARSDSQTFHKLLKAVKVSLQNIITTSEPSPILELIIRTPMRWADYASHGPNDMVEPWIIGAILELSAISLYRRPFIQDRVGGFLRQLIESVLAPYLPGSTPQFPWPDRLRNDNELEELEDPSSALALMDSATTKYRQQAMAELGRIMQRTHDSFIAVTNNKFETKVSSKARITPEVAFALKALYAVCIEPVQSNVSLHCSNIYAGTHVEYRTQHLRGSVYRCARRWS